MNNWVHIKLGEFTEWFSGGTPSKQKEEFWNGEIPWISAKTLKGNRISDSETKITKLGLENGSRVAIKDDILILVRGSGLFNFIPISIVEKPVAFNQDIKSIRIKSDYSYISPWFLLFWFHSNRRLLKGIMEETGIGAGKFDTKMLQNLIVEIPPEGELNEITKTFKCIDDKIENLQAQNKTLEQTAQTIFAAWFGKYQVGDELPEGWRVGKLGEEIKTVLGGTPSKKIDEYWDNGTIPWINSGAINNFRIIKESLLITEMGLKKSAAKLVPIGTVLIAITGATLGQYSRTEIECCFNQSVIGLKPNYFFHSSFIYYWIANNIHLIIRKATGGAHQHINKENVNQTDFIIPPKKELKEFYSMVDPLLEKISNNMFQIESLKKTRDTLLPKLMSGQLRVNEFKR